MVLPGVTLQVQVQCFVATIESVTVVVFANGFFVPNR